MLDATGKVFNQILSGCVLIDLVKVGMMIDAIKLYILIRVSLTLTLIQGHRSAGKLKFLCQLSHRAFD